MYVECQLTDGIVQPLIQLAFVLQHVWRLMWFVFVNFALTIVFSFSPKLDIAVFSYQSVRCKFRPVFPPLNSHFSSFGGLVGACLSDSSGGFSGRKKNLKKGMTNTQTISSISGHETCLRDIARACKCALPAAHRKFDFSGAVLVSMHLLILLFRSWFEGVEVFCCSRRR
jgi:hypothetical protein